MGKKPRYKHRAFMASRDFGVTKVGRDFTFEGEDVEFCAGLAVKDGQFYFAYGFSTKRRLY